MTFATFGRIAVTALLIAAPLGVASAADMPVKAPKAPPPPAYSWTGFYIGVNGGGAQGNTTWQYYFFPGPAPSSTAFANHDVGGGMVGGTVGFNWQAPGSQWVVGVEGDWDWSNIVGNSVCPGVTFDCESKIRDVATARGRLGWAEGGVLFYGTAGAAWGNVRIQTVNEAGVSPPTGTPTNGTTSTRLGWTGGGGIEVNIAQTPLSVKAEVLYYDLGAHFFNVDAPIIQTVRARENGTMVRAGLNWRLGNWALK